MDLLLIALVILLLLVLVLPLFKIYRKNKFIHQCIDILPGDKWYPLVGTCYSLLKAPAEDRWEVTSKRHKIFGPIFRSWYGSIPTVHIFKPSHIEKILKSHINIKKGRIYHVIEPWLGQGLLSATGAYWRRHRKIIRPAFYGAILDRYMDVFNECAQNFVDILEQHVEEEYTDIFSYINQIGLDVIAETAMGVKIDFLKNPRSEYPEAIENYIILAVKQAFNPIGHIDFLFGLTNDAKKKKESLDIINKFNKKGITSLLLSYQETDNFTDEEIEEEVNTFTFGGQDTTSLTITYTLLAIGNHPHVQRRLQEEIDSIYQGDERPITSEDLSKMVYMDRVIKETLRVYYFVPSMSRMLVEDIEIDGLLIPKDVTVIISMHDLHHDPEIYPEPEKFDPDRFLPEVSAKRHPYAYIPFSAGPRSCIGQNFGLKNTKTMLAYILRKFNITCLEKPEDIKKAYEIVLKPLSGLKVKLEKRHT